MSDAVPPVAQVPRTPGNAGAMDSGRWLAAILASSDDAIIGESLEGVITSWNAGATRIFGYEAHEAIGQPVSFLAWPGEKDLFESFLEQLRRGGHVDHCEVSRRHKSGKKIIVSLSLLPIVGDDGKTFGIAKIARDITEHKLEELRVRTLQETYMAELELRRTEADSVRQAKDEFTANLSHELRTPLHAIMGFAELLLEESTGPLNQKQRNFVHHIQQDSEYLHSLISRVLDMSRNEAGGYKLHEEYLSLRDAVAESVSAMRPYADSRSLSLVEGDHLDVTVCADSMRLRQILYNLLSNAVKFTAPGGIVTVDAALQDKLVEVTVSDTGVGIAPEECARVFEKFYQVEPAAGQEHEGTGLGLAICRQLVEMQGGTIWVDSELHKGSRFHFTLPVD